MTNLNGTNSDDTITATSSGDALFGEDGNDLLIGVTNAIDIAESVL